jgi:hypothetical protein
MVIKYKMMDRSEAHVPLDVRDRNLGIKRRILYLERPLRFPVTNRLGGCSTQSKSGGADTGT